MDRYRSQALLPCVDRATVPLHIRVLLVASIYEVTLEIEEVYRQIRWILLYLVIIRKEVMRNTSSFLSLFTDAYGPCLHDGILLDLIESLNLTVCLSTT